MAVYTPTTFRNNILFSRQPYSVFDLNNFLIKSPGVTLWLRADAHITSDGTFSDTPINGDPVQGWYNSNSAYSDFAYSLGADRPTYKTNQLNGLPIVSFNSAFSQYMATQEQQNYNIYTPSIFLVGKNYGSGGDFCGKGSNSVDPNGQAGANSVIHRKLLILSESAGTLITYWRGTDSMGSCAAPATTSNWNIYSFISHYNTKTNLNVNGVDLYNYATINDSSFNTNKFCLGCGFDIGAEFGTVDIAEIIILNFSAPDWLKQLIIQYLSNKWGIFVTNTVPANLPNRSPIATARPLA